MSADPADNSVSPEGVAERMADAILYLCSVAEKAGLDAISDELMSVRWKLTGRRIQPAHDGGGPSASGGNKVLGGRG